MAWNEKNGDATGDPRSGSLLALAVENIVIADGETYESDIIPTKKYSAIGGSIKADRNGTLTVVRLEDEDGTVEGETSEPLNFLANAVANWHVDPLYAPRVKLVIANDSGAQMTVSHLVARGRAV